MEKVPIGLNTDLWRPMELKRLDYTSKHFREKSTRATPQSVAEQSL
jgi:hypothetical protein